MLRGTAGRDDARVSTTAACPEVDYTATVRRPRFDELPEGVQAAIGTASGAPVVRADDPPRSGFTGGFAAVVHLADAQRLRQGRLVGEPPPGGRVRTGGRGAAGAARPATATCGPTTR
jgi:hypothetical protein